MFLLEKMDSNVSIETIIKASGLEYNPSVGVCFTHFTHSVNALTL